MFLQTVLMALREIRRNTLRSVLTMLGVVIGVGAVIALVSVGRGATQKVTEDIGKLGKNLLMVSAGARVRGGASSAAQALKMADMKAIEQEISGVHAVAPGSSSQQQIIYGNKNASTQVTGTDNNFLEVRGYTIDQGRSFTQQEAQAGISVCVLGATVKNALFGGQDAIGKQVRVGKLSCQIIGTLVSKGTAGMGQDQDDLLIMPLGAFQRRITGNNDISLILVSAEEGLDTAIVAESIRALLRQRCGCGLDAVPIAGGDGGVDGVGVLLGLPCKTSGLGPILGLPVGFRFRERGREDRTLFLHRRRVHLIDRGAQRRVGRADLPHQLLEFELLGRHRRRNHFRDVHSG